MAVYEAFIGRITTPLAHIVAEGRSQQNSYFCLAQNRKQDICAILVNI